MLEHTVEELYAKFKLQFFRQIFGRFEAREATLTAVETFCVEAIHALGSPTVNEFADFVHISPANAAYKVGSLIKKGYIVKRQSNADRREYHLEVTDKFKRYYGISFRYVSQVLQRIRERFSAEDVQKFEEMLQAISNELMPEIQLPGHEDHPTA